MARASDRVVRAVRGQAERIDPKLGAIAKKIGARLRPGRVEYRRATGESRTVPIKGVAVSLDSDYDRASIVRGVVVPFDLASYVISGQADAATKIEASGVTGGVVGAAVGWEVNADADNAIGKRRLRF